MRPRVNIAWLSSVCTRVSQIGGAQNKAHFPGLSPVGPPPAVCQFVRHRSSIRQPPFVSSPASS